MAKFSRLLVAGAACFVLPITARAGETRRVWIDSDLAVGSPWREVDDGYALLLAARSPGLRIAGISSSYGNASLPITTARTRESLGLALAVSPGARSAADLGLATEATRGLKAALRQIKLTYIALGPLTNLATFIQLHPGLATRIDQIIMVAGESASANLAFGPAKIFRVHDANVRKDPDAARTILRTRIPILLAPIETSTRLLVDRCRPARDRAKWSGRKLSGGAEPILVLVLDHDREKKRWTDFRRARDCRRGATGIDHDRGWLRSRRRRRKIDR